MNEHQFFNGARYFEKKGYASFRFDLYGYRNNQRNLQDCTLETHADDLDTVVRALKEKGMHSFSLVGHSFGGPTVLLSKAAHRASSIVFWDPSYRTNWDGVKRIPGTRFARMPRGKEVLIGQRMMQHTLTMDWDALIPAITVPIKFVLAGAGHLLHTRRAYYAKARKPKALTIIPKADHIFSIDGTEEKLLTETVHWIRKYTPRRWKR